MHPLHDEQFLFMLEQMRNGNDRRTGRSTAYALRIISEAILSPGKPIRIIDHYGTHEANRMLATMIAQMIDKLGLKYMTIRQSDLTLNFAKE